MKQEEEVAELRKYLYLAGLLTALGGTMLGVWYLIGQIREEIGRLLGEEIESPYKARS